MTSEARLIAQRKLRNRYPSVLEKLLAVFHDRGAGAIIFLFPDRFRCPLLRQRNSLKREFRKQKKKKEKSTKSSYNCARQSRSRVDRSRAELNGVEERSRKVRKRGCQCTERVIRLEFPRAPSNTARMFGDNSDMSL